MDKFTERYEKLNPEQRKAVDHIEGPLLVVAGPGTGKTEILSLRVANIIRKTEVSPKNILCLTFTASASQNMRQRLSELIGRDAYKVAIHTFHSFGVEIIESNPDYFFDGCMFNPVDELTQIEILEGIISGLPEDDDLGNLHPDGHYAYLGSIKSSIGDLKKAGITPEEFKAILEFNKKSLERINPEIESVFSPKVTKKTAESIQNFIGSLSSKSQEDSPFPDIASIVDTLRTSLTSVLSDAAMSATTGPITDWKKKRTQKDNDGSIILKDTLYLEKLLSLAYIYSEYEKRMKELSYYDYDDMILKVIQQIEERNNLKYDICDYYQYILVDEFQDTNDAQMRLLNLISGNNTDVPPNIMAVGDDDQAIYKFQGAQIKNILNFTDTYPSSKVVTITSNYRSKQEIVDLASYVISQSSERLHTTMPEVQKDIVSRIDAKAPAFISCESFSNCLHEYNFVCNKIKALINDGIKPSEIAVIARKHEQLEEISLLLNKLEVPFTYEKGRNVLDEPHVRQLITIGCYVSTLCRKNEREADELLPEILRYPFWALERLTILDISRKAQNKKGHDHNWLDIMREYPDERVRDIAHFLLELTKLCSNESLEGILDKIMGTKGELAPDSEQDEGSAEEVSDSSETKFVSPFKDFYFSEEKRKQNPLQFLNFLSGLRVFVKAIGDYKKDRVLKIDDLPRFVELHRRNNIPIIDNSQFMNSSEAVNLLTAHKAKGLEFDTVFLVNCQEDTWAGRKRGSNLPMPINLPISPSSDTTDDQMRLFYVALTRTKNNLYLSSYRYDDDNNKESPIVSFILPPQEVSETSLVQNILKQNEHKLEHESLIELENMLTLSWDSMIAPPFTFDEKEILESILKDYRLSVTHLNNFLNVVNVGPHAFYIQNILRFPQSQSDNHSYGISVHRTIELIYMHLKSEDRMPEIETVLEWYRNELLMKRLKDSSFKKYLEKGCKALRVYYENKFKGFKKSHYSEFNFNGQGVLIGDAHLAGTIDKMVPINESEIIVHDFKTGKAKPKWKGNTTQENIQLYNYSRQLIFYKILVENSKDFGGQFHVDRGVLEFVEPKDGELVDLEWEIGKDELRRTEELIKIVYNKICALDFPDTSSYKQNLGGIISFEDDLLDGKI